MIRLLRSWIHAVFSFDMGVKAQVLLESIIDNVNGLMTDASHVDTMGPRLTVYALFSACRPSTYSSSFSRSFLPSIAHQILGSSWLIPLRSNDSHRQTSWLPIFRAAAAWSLVEREFAEPHEMTVRYDSSI